MTESQKAFTLNFAPNFNQLKTTCGSITKPPTPQVYIDKLKAFYDLGFRAIECNEMQRINVECQKAIADEMEKLGMQMGVFVALADFSSRTFTGNILGDTSKVRDKKAVREFLTKKMKDTCEVAKRVNAKWATLVPGGFDNTLSLGYQNVNLIENLKFCADICEKENLILVLEPLNFQNHPLAFIAKIAQAYEICKAVNSPSCKILDDLYHQQITEGNLITNIDLAWEEIAYFQVGSVPNRKEASIGEINYKNIFKHIHKKGYKDPIGLEHSQSKQTKEGDKFFLDNYRNLDLEA